MYERRIEKIGQIQVSASPWPYAQIVRYLNDACANGCVS